MEVRCMPSSCRKSAENTVVYVCTAFVDLTMCPGNNMSKFGHQDRFVPMVHQFHDVMKAHVLDNGDSFPLRFQPPHQ